MFINCFCFLKAFHQHYYKLLLTFLQIINIGKEPWTSLKIIDSTKNCWFSCILVFFPQIIIRCTKIGVEGSYSCLIKPTEFLMNKKHMLELTS